MAFFTYLLTDGMDLPANRLCEGTLPVRDCFRKLTTCQISLPNAFEECGVLSKFPAVELMGIDDPDRQPDLLGDNSNRLCQVGVVCNQYCNLELHSIGISQQVGGEVDVRPLLLRLVHQTFWAGVTWVRYIGTE